MDDDTGFQDYEPSTIVPGPWLIVGTTLFCVLTLAILAFSVRANNHKRRRIRSDARYKVPPEYGSIETPPTGVGSDEDSLVSAADGDIVAIPSKTTSTHLPNGDANLDRTNDDGEDKEVMLDDTTMDGTAFADESKKSVTIIQQVTRLDQETKNIIKLAFPYALKSLFTSGFTLLFVAVIGKLMGTHALSAYFAVEFITYFTSMWLAGLNSSLSALCSQAIGTGNYQLAGQYVQIGVVSSMALYVPHTILWTFFVDDVIVWFGFDEDVAAIGHDYAIIYLLHGWFECMPSGISYLLDVSGHEDYNAAFSGAKAAVGLVCIFTVALTCNPTLKTIGIIEWIVDVAFFGFNIAYIHREGWFEQYWPGIIGSNAFKNVQTVQTYLRMAVPMSLSYVCVYGEWEILNIVAGLLGPAELAAWGFISQIWTNLECVPAAVGSAGEVRCAHLLGEGKPRKAKLSAYKTIYLGSLVGLASSLLLIMLAGHIPGWLTNDQTLQSMVHDVIPVLGIGNIFLTSGYMCWALLGAQSRYDLATKVGFAGSWFATIPLAFLSAYVFKFDLRGVMAAAVVGYMMSGNMNAFYLFVSDWNQISIAIREDNGADVP